MDLDCDFMREKSLFFNKGRHISSEIVPVLMAGWPVRLLEMLKISLTHVNRNYHGNLVEIIVEVQLGNTK